MSTTTETGVTPAAAAVEQEDPWRYGWRYVRRQRPDGTEYVEEVPLRQEDLLFPHESDFVVNTEGHNRDRGYLKNVLTAWAARREGAIALEDHRVDWEVAGLQPLGPDIVVFDGLREAWNPDRGTIPVRTFGARTLLVIEVTSPDTRANDLGIKVDFYRRVGALFYAIVDRHETRAGVQLHLLGYRTDPTNPSRYVEAAADGRSRLWLETVRLWLAAEDGRAVLYDENDRRIPDPAEALELMQAAMRRAAAEEQARRAAEERAAAEEQARRAAEERAAAEEQARRAAEERADAADTRLRELEAEMQRLRGGGGPPSPAAP